MTPSPALDLVGAYGTVMQKTAGDTASLALRMALALMLQERGRRGVYQEYGKARERQQLAEEHSRTEMAPTNAALRYTRPPILIAPMLPAETMDGSGALGTGTIANVPVGLDAGMVRLAHVVGAGLARKVAGVAPGAAVAQAVKEAPGFWGKSFGKGKALTTILGVGAVGAAAYGANKLVNKTNQIMSREAAPADWSNRNSGGPQLSYGTNQYGYAQPGTPFTG